MNTGREKGSWRVAVRRWTVHRLGLGEVGLGVLEGVAVLVLATAGLTWVFDRIPLPSEKTLESCVQIGVVLVLAYVVEAVWLARQMAREPDYENRLGALTGIGVGGMIGVAVAILLVAHRAAGHANLLDAIGSGWVLSSLFLLAGMVVIQPFLVYDWESADSHGDGEA